jgi:HAMP domain-containing protein
MSLYRETSGRSAKTLALVALGAVALLAIGFALGRATAPTPSLETQLAELRQDARPAADALELVAIHYGATNDSTREAASSQLDRARASFEAIEDELALVDPEHTHAARAAIEELSSLVASDAPAAEVERAAADAEAAVRAAAGDGTS